jgi:hypothetical protein
MEHANEEWQRYAEQRDQYVRVLAQRCGELGLALNSSKRPASDSKLSAEQQTKIDRLLLDQRRKMELVQEAKNQVVYVNSDVITFSRTVDKRL